MGIISSALTSKTCANCVHMPKGYYCKKLEKCFDCQKIDRGFVPCGGEHFKHYASERGIPLYVVNRKGEIVATGEYKGE